MNLTHLLGREFKSFHTVFEFPWPLEVPNTPKQPRPGSIWLRPDESECSQRLDLPETFNQETVSTSSLCVLFHDLSSSQGSRTCTVTPKTRQLFNLMVLIRITNMSASDKRVYVHVRAHVSAFGQVVKECLNNSLINIRARFIAFEAYLPFVGKH